MSEYKILNPPQFLNVCSVLRVYDTCIQKIWRVLDFTIIRKAHK